MLRHRRKKAQSAAPDRRSLRLSTSCTCMDLNRLEWLVTKSRVRVLGTPCHRPAADARAYAGRGRGLGDVMFVDFAWYQRSASLAFAREYLENVVGKSSRAQQRL